MMATAMDTNTSLNYENWLVNKARSYLKADPSAAKAWLITGRTSFPSNFLIQYEAYCIEKANRNKVEAVKLLEEMLKYFSNNSVLLSETQNIAKSLQAEVKNEQSKFDADMFYSLPSGLQRQVLLHVADTTKDVLSYCSISLLMLKTYPDCIHEEGIKLIDSLISAETQAYTNTPINPYRKYMVCDVLPLVLDASPANLQNKHMMRWLQKSFEYIICSATQPRSQEPRISEEEEPWERLVNLLCKFGPHLKWNLELLMPSTNLDTTWPQLQNFYRNLNHKPGTDLSSPHRQLLYCILPIFFDNLHQYTKLVDPELYSGTSLSNGNPQIVMVEGFRKDNREFTEHRTKKHKAESSSPQIKGSKQMSSLADIIKSFHNAVRCWDLIHSSHVLESEFNRLTHQWKSESWIWLKNFEIDVLMYQGQHTAAIRFMNSMLKSSSNQEMKIRFLVTLASCYYSLGKLPEAYETSRDLITALNYNSTISSISILSTAQQVSYIKQITSASSGRHVQLLFCSKSDILAFAMHLLISTFKDVALKPVNLKAKVNDALGHTIVLLQYDWPRYESLFYEAVDIIKSTGSFIYNMFFSYIINIDILEEISYLKTTEGGKVNLDILPLSNKAISQQRTVTRGVNKNVKEDFKATMEKQVARSSENINHVIFTFLKEEQQILYFCLSGLEKS